MTRAVLSVLVCMLALVLGLWTAWVQSANHALADDLDRMKREDDLVAAGNESLEAEILTRLYALEREWADPEGAARCEPLEVPER